MADDKTKNPDEKKDGGNTADNDKTKKHHAKHIIGRVNHNNIDLSRHAKHDWQPAHEARRKAVAEKLAAGKDAKTTYSDIYVRAYFQELDRVGTEGELVPANDPELDPLVPTLLATYLIEVPGGDSALDLLAAIQSKSGDFIICIPDPTDDPTVPYYLSSVTIDETPYSTTDESGDPENPGYEPDPGPVPGHRVSRPNTCGLAWLGVDVLQRPLWGTPVGSE
jgi:hypothetical protein